MSSTCSSIGDRSIDDAEVVHILCSRESSGWDSDEDDTTKLAIGEVLSNTPDAPLFSSSPVAFAAKAAALFRVDLSSNSFIDDEDLLEVIAATPNVYSLVLGNYIPGIRHDAILALSSNGVTALSFMKNLRHLAIGDCAIGDNGIAIISRLSKLRSLHIGCLNLSQYALIYIGTMSELEYLNLDHACRLTFKDMPRSIANLTKLTYLNLRMAMPRCHRRTHGGVEPMPASFRHLQFLNLDKCPLVGDWAAALALNTPALKRLFLRNARGVCDPDLVHIATLSLLQHLDLRECFNVSLDGLAYLQALVNLKHVAFPMLADIASAEYSKLLNGFKSSSLATIQAPEKHDPIWNMPTEKSIDEVRLLAPQFVRVVGCGEEEFETWNHVKVPKAVHCNGDVWCLALDRERESTHDKGENNRMRHL